MRADDGFSFSFDISCGPMDTELEFEGRVALVVCSSSEWRYTDLYLVSEGGNWVDSNLKAGSLMHLLHGIGLESLCNFI